MQCDHAHELFSDFVSDSLDKALAVSLENHLATCGDCREEVAGLRRVWATLSEMPIAEPPAFFHENIMSRLDAAQVEAEEAAARKHALWDWRALFRPRTLAFAAAALILLLAGGTVIKATSANLSPLAYIEQLFHSQPAPQPIAPTVKAEWVPKPEGGGAVKVTLHVNRVPEADAANGGIAYTIKVEGDSARANGTVGADQDAVSTLSVAQVPAGNTLRVSILLMPASGGSIPVTKEISLPPAPAALEASPSGE